MKRHFFYATLVFLVTYTSKGQSNSIIRPISNGTTVQMKWASDWAKSVMVFKSNDSYWEEPRDTLIKQLGEYEFERMKRNIAVAKIPCAMSLFCKGRLKNSDSVFNKWAQLKVQKVASYQKHSPDNSIGYWDLVRIPYPENKDWDSNAVWDTVYFAMMAGYLQPFNAELVTKLSPYIVKFPEAKISDWTKLIAPTKEWPRIWHLDKAELARKINATNQTTVSVVFGSLKPFPAFDPNTYSSTKEYNQRMQELKAYYVGEIKGEDEQAYTILRIPYKENAGWNPNVKWDSNRETTQYVIAPSNLVKLKGSGFIENLKIQAP